MTTTKELIAEYRQKFNDNLIRIYALREQNMQLAKLIRELEYTIH